MKYLLSFLFGAVVGAGGTLLWLRKDIKKELAEMEARSKAPESDDVPFTMGEGKDSGNGSESLRGAKNGLRSEDDVPVARRPEVKVEYNKIINAVQKGEEPRLKVPVLPREDYPEAHYISDEERKANFVDRDEGDEAFPIDYETFRHEKNYTQERYVYFRGDKIMCTEEGTVIDTPALMVGANWEEFVGREKERSAYIRNPRLNTDYEIYVEDGLYEDEYGPPD